MLDSIQKREPNDLHQRLDDQSLQKPLDNATVSVQLTSSNSDMHFSPDNFFQLYENAFLVSTDAAKVLDGCPLEDIITATMMYNIGLLCHRQGALRGDCKILRRALQMYEMAAATVRRHRSHYECGHFLLALTNNMGHIYSHFYQLDKALSCRVMIERLIDDELMMIDFVDEAPELHFFLQSLQFREFELKLAPAA